MANSYELNRCVVCNGTDTTEVAGPEEIRAEAESLWEFHMRRLSPGTPPERLVDRVAFSQEPAWRIVRCRICGLVYRNPAEKRVELREAYETPAPPRETLLGLHDAQAATYRTQARRLRRVLGRRGSGLEVGSYVGAFLAAARAKGWRFEGIDVNPHINAFSRSLGFTVHDGDLETFRPEREFDAVAIWNTFDQLPDPKTAVLASRRLLRSGGVLAIRVPNGECYATWRTHRIRAVAVAVLAHNNLLTFPYRFGFTPQALTRLLRDVGFEVERLVGDVLVPTADEWTRPWARAEERLIKPLTRGAMPWFEIYARSI
jgi:SAM-dependent methyltransferase